MLGGAGLTQEGEGRWALKPGPTASSVSLLVVLLAFAAFVSIGTLALFTDSAEVTDNSFTTGDVDINAARVSALVTYSNMAPGDTVTDDLVVSNDGSLDLRYAIRSSATNADLKGLKDQLVLTVRTADLVTLDGPCNQFDGTQLYSGDTDSTAGNLVGDPASGAQAGDRALTAAANETLRFRVDLPLTTGSAFANATTTVTFTLDAEQTRNN